MNFRKILVAFLLLTLILPATVYSAKLPNSVWAPLDRFTSAVNVGNNAGIYESGMELIRIVENEPDSQTKTEFLTGKYIQVAEAAELLGNYAAAAELYSKYVPYAAVMNHTDGVIFAKRKAKLLTGRLEVFYEAPSSAQQPYYTGARFEPENGVLFGSVYAQEPAIDGYDAKLIEKIYGKHPSLNLVYMEFGEDPVTLGRYTKYFNEIKESGGEIMFAWNTTTPLADVENHADYIYNTVKWLDSWDIDIIVRFGAEMNVGPNGNDAEAYKKSFRYVADVIHKNSDMAVCWSPNDIGALDRPYEMYYPGDEYVDWIGASHYTCMHFQGLNNPDSKQQDLSDSYFYCFDYADPVLKLSELVEFMQQNGIVKPIAITECGAPHLTNYTERVDTWGVCHLYKIYGELIRMYPQIKAMCYFNVERLQESQHFALYASPDVKNAYIDATTHENKFLEYPKDDCDFVFSKNLPDTVTESSLELSASAYYPHSENGSVVYLVDGVWYHQTSISPYKCTLDLSKFDNGVHTITVKYCSPDGIELLRKEHTFNLNVPIKVTVDGKEVNFPDCAPFVTEGRTLVPLRAIFETLGATVGWEDATQTVTATRGDITVVFTIGNNILTKNGGSSTMDVPPQIYNTRTVVPVRAIAESFGCNVGWDEKTKTVIITTK